MSPNRIVALLTPLVFAPAAGAISAWLAQHFPGVDVSAGDLQQIFVAGALVALVPAAQWLHGWQKHEARQADADHAVELAAAAAAQPAADVSGTTATLDELTDLDAVPDVDDADDDDLLPDPAADSALNAG
jgi:hypothetical protein